MTDREVQRRLAAILAADVAGYTRLMEEDTDGTVAAWQTARDDVVEPTITKHSGRTVKLTGDGFLAEFPTVQEAVRCALEMQIGLADSSLDFRMGVNMGDIVDDGQDIHGEGVNVAARIEALADIGGISISGSVYEQVRNRIEAIFEDRGEHEVKNVTAPVRIFALRLVESSEVAPQSVKVINKKPSIAVLPFDNLSGDPEQEYFSDGITEDIITALSRIQQFFVIARNTTFTYKGQAVNVQTVAKDLDIRYVLEGSVRRAGDRVRITAQLIDGVTGKHIWAERYDRELQDVFDVQDEITKIVVGSLEPAITGEEIERVKSKRPENLDAWDLVMRATGLISKFSEKASEDALTALDEALAIDPNYARAHSLRSWAVIWRAFQGWQDAEGAVAVAYDSGNRAIEADSLDPWAYVGLSYVSLFTRQGEDAIKFARKSVTLNPNFAYGYTFLGAALALAGQGDLAFPEIETAIKLSPRDILRDEFNLHRAMASFQVRDYEQTIEAGTEAWMPRPDHLFPHVLTLSAAGQTGNKIVVDREMNHIHRLVPDYDIEEATKRCPYSDTDTANRLIEGLRKAGLLND